MKTSFLKRALAVALAGWMSVATPALGFHIHSTKAMLALEALIDQSGYVTITGSGGTAFTANSFVYAGTGGALTSTSAPTNGQLLIGSTGAAPALATLTGTANRVTVTNAAGSITLSAPQDLHTGASPTFTGLTVDGTAFPIATFKRTLAGTGNTQDVLRVFRNNTTPLVGDGAGLSLSLLNDAGATKDYGQIYSVARMLTSGLEEGRVILKTMMSGGKIEVARFTTSVIDQSSPGLALTTHALDPNLSGFSQASTVVTIAGGYGTSTVGALELGSHKDLGVPDNPAGEIVLFRRGNTSGVLNKLVQIQGIATGTEDNHGGKLVILLRNAGGGGATTTGLTMIGSSSTFGNSVVAPVFIVGSASLTTTTGAIGLSKMTASASAPGAAGAKFEVVCGTNAGTVKLIMYGGTSATAVTVVDNVGAGVTGC